MYIFYVSFIFYISCTYTFLYIIIISNIYIYTFILSCMIFMYTPFSINSLYVNICILIVVFNILVYIMYSYFKYYIICVYISCMNFNSILYLLFSLLLFIIIIYIYIDMYLIIKNTVFLLRYYIGVMFLYRVSNIILHKLFIHIIIF